MFNNKDLEEFNDDVKGWAKEAITHLKKSVDANSIKTYKNSRDVVSLKNSLRAKTISKEGMVTRISFSMNRSGVFVHKGVSRGHPINNPRKPKPWFNPVIKQDLPGLSNIVAKRTGQMIVNALKIK